MVCSVGAFYMIIRLWIFVIRDGVKLVNLRQRLRGLVFCIIHFAKLEPVGRTAQKSKQGTMEDEEQGDEGRPLPSFAGKEDGAENEARGTTAFGSGEIPHRRDHCKDFIVSCVME